MSRGLESGRVEGVLEIKVAEPQCWICEGLCVFVSSSGACTLQVGSGSRSQEECFFWPNVPAGLHRSRLGRSALLSLCTSSTPACLYVHVAPQPARQHPIAYNRHIPCSTARKALCGTQLDGACYKFGILTGCYLRPKQPGAPHSSFGTYLKMPQQASISALKPACCTSRT